nr:hypothetical protein GCM10020092_098570 [Actinoplanes digitatis]
MLSIGATVRGSDERADYSNYGPSWVDMVAPGQVLVPVGDKFQVLEGTSFSTPMVAGAAALVKSQHPEYTGWSISRALRVAARPLDYDGDGEHDAWAQYGMLDAAKALTIGTELDPPTITGISYPGANWRLRGTFNVTPTGVADAWSGIRNVDLYVDGVYKSQDRTAPYALPFNTADRNGTVKMQLRVYDKAEQPHHLRPHHHRGQHGSDREDHQRAEEQGEGQGHGEARGHRFRHLRHAPGGDADERQGDPDGHRRAVQVQLHGVQAAEEDEGADPGGRPG